MHDPRLEMRAHASAHILHRPRLFDGEIDEGGAEQIERGEEIEIRGEAETKKGRPVGTTLPLSYFGP